MYITLVHNGDKERTALATAIADMLEEDGHVCEQSIGSNDNLVTLYSEDHQVLANFDKEPDPNILRFFVELADE